jgi:hypothetical protein
MASRVEARRVNIVARQVAISSVRQGICALRDDCYTDVCCLCAVADLTRALRLKMQTQKQLKRKQRPWVTRGQIAQW